MRNLKTVAQAELIPHVFIAWCTASAIFVILVQIPAYSSAYDKLFKIQIKTCSKTKRVFSQVFIIKKCLCAILVALFSNLFF